MTAHPCAIICVTSKIQIEIFNVILEAMILIIAHRIIRGIRVGTIIGVIEHLAINTVILDDFAGDQIAQPHRHFQRGGRIGFILIRIIERFDIYRELARLWRLAGLMHIRAATGIRPRRDARGEFHRELLAEDFKLELHFPSLRRSQHRFPERVIKFRYDPFGFLACRWVVEIKPDTFEEVAGEDDRGGFDGVGFWGKCFCDLKFK
jgi:hypothetical protein